MKVEITIEAGNIWQINAALIAIRKELIQKRINKKLKLRDKFDSFLLASKVGNGNWVIVVDAE